MDKTRDLHKAIASMQEENAIWMDYLKHQNNDALYESFREYIKCFEKLLKAHENVLKNFKVDNEALE